MTVLTEDLGHALRQWRSSSGSIAVVSLALGIGAKIATFGLVDSAFLRPVFLPTENAWFQRCWPIRVWKAFAKMLARKISRGSAHVGKQILILNAVE
jgi:hypothetical protein